jgi:DNA-binding MarR family transcriptional regulator
MKLDKAAILIKKAALEFDKISNAVLEKYDLTTAQYKVMMYLYEESEKGVRIVDLEKYYSISHPTTIGIVQNLEKKGLVVYQDNPNHARSRFIVPTSKAIQIKKELESVGAKLETELTKNLSEKERRELVVLLRKMMGLSGE